ncbi:MAG: hypothetical protein PVG75_12105 [Thioalkalispiraceae bacterium]|jgi:hypothetical protein
MFRTRTYLLIISLIITLPGCSIFSFSDDDINTLNLAKELLKSQLDEHGEPKKIDLPVRVHYTTTHKPMIDRELLVEFEFITEQALPVLRFAVTTSDGLELVDNDIEPVYRALKTRAVIKSRVEVMPTSENKFYLNVFVVTEVGEDRRAKHIKIPIAVGDYSLSDNPPPRQ